MNKLKKSKTSKRSSTESGDSKSIVMSKKFKLIEDDLVNNNSKKFNTCLVKSNRKHEVIDLVNDDSIHPISWMYSPSNSPLCDLSDTSWLSSSQIEVVISQFARCYPDTTFLSPDFAAFDISKEPKHLDIDVLGNFIHPPTCEYSDQRNPIVCVFNSRDIHWNIVRINFTPMRSLQLFEPMGKPTGRRVKPATSMSFRDIPATLIKWLDSRWPMANKESWLAVGTSVITTQQQYTTYDCGVACLLYAEKCAIGQVSCPAPFNDINDKYNPICALVYTYI